MASANRLHLDFKLTTTEERNAFLQQYLQHPQFTERPPTEDELETMANYLLWGKDPVTGLNVKQEGLIDIETKHSTWSKNNTESLEGLMESPTFNEASLMTLDAAPPAKSKKEVFSRKEALANCPESMVADFTELFNRIDRMEMMINLYELAHGKREKPPREQLAAKFDEEEQCRMREAISHWNQFRYLKMRHELVELRREQYTLRDSFQSSMLSAPTTDADTYDSRPAFDVGIEVLPLGLKMDQGIPGLVFRKWIDLIPANYSEETLKPISDLYWSKQNYKPGSQQHYIDFRELEHVYEMFQVFFELNDAAVEADLESTLPQLMATLNFYIEQADLGEMQREILDMKLRKVKNVDIALAVNKKWKKTYTPNYISTIFRQHIIPKINDAAKYHEKIVGNLFFEEEFKTCPKCGRTLLRDAENFTRRSRSKDGFTNRCKACEKLSRNGE